MKKKVRNQTTTSSLLRFGSVFFFVSLGWFSCDGGEARPVRLWWWWCSAGSVFELYSWVFFDFSVFDLKVEEREMNLVFVIKGA